MQDTTEPRDKVYGHIYRHGADRREGWVPVDHLAPSVTYNFFVRLFRSEQTQSLGLSLHSDEGNKYLIIEVVQPGSLVDVWNEGCLLTFPRDALRRGDRILAVNETRGNCSDLLAVMRLELALRVCVQRASSGEPAEGSAR